MDGFKYPIASEEELVDFFNSNFLMNISSEAYIKPTKELVCSIYDKFLFDFNIEYGVPQLKAVQTDNMAMNSVSFRYLSLFAALSELLAKAGFSDFTFGDLSKPQRRRNQIIFSQLAGLWSWFFEIQETWKAVASKHEMMARKKNEVRRRIEENKRMYELKLLESSELQEDMPNTERELAEAAERFAEEKAKSTVLKSQQEKLKRGLMAMKEKRADLQQQNAQQKEELAEVETKLVRSPDKVFAEATRKEKLRDEVRAERQAINKQLMEKRAELNSLKEELEDDNLLIKVLEELATHLKKLKEDVSITQKSEDEISARETRMSQLDIQIAKVNEICEGIVKQQSIAAKSHNQRVSTLKDMINEISQTISNLEKEESTNIESSSTTEHSLLNQLNQLKSEYEEKVKHYEEVNLLEKMTFVKCMETYTPKIIIILDSSQH